MMKIKWGRVAALVGVGIGVCLLVAEATTRLVGLTSFPIYVRAPMVAYYPAPNQHGQFLNMNHWYVNDQGFENDRSFSVSHPSALLIGDSVVYGGNPVDYRQQIGTIAAEKWGGQIWVASAGGWNLLNELAFLKMHIPQVRSVDRLVFILNEGDFGEPAHWSGELSFPTQRPLFAAFYIFRRYVLPHPSELPMVTVKNDQVFQREWLAEFDALLNDYHGPITIILYPSKKDFRDGPAWKSDTAAIRSYVANHSKQMTIVDVRENPRWNISMYKDGIHPNLVGNRVLGELVANICLAEATQH